MDNSEIPEIIPSVFASSAPAGNVSDPFPNTGQPNGLASWPTGFTGLNFIPVAGGGVPPWGRDFNGIFKVISGWAQWFQLGGIVPYNSVLQADVGGYPNGATVASLTIPFRFWRSIVDNNVTNPDLGGAGWIPWPQQITLAHGEVYFSYSNPNQLLLLPHNGSAIICGGAQSLIPSSVQVANTNVTINGIPNQNLTSNGTYYASFNGARIGFWDPSVYSHAPDTLSTNAGVEVITQTGVPVLNDTETLVGIIRTDASGNFQTQGIGVCSWFNPKPIVLQGSATGTFAVSAITPNAQEITGSSRINFVSFAGRPTETNIVGSAELNVDMQSFAVITGLDGSNSGATIPGSTCGYPIPIGLSANATGWGSGTVPSDGHHFISSLGSVTGGGSPTATYLAIFQTLSTQA